MQSLQSVQEFFGDLLDWIVAVIRHSGAFFFGLFVSAIIFFDEHIKGQPISWEILLPILCGCLFVALFRSWREEHRLVRDYRAAIKEIEIPCFDHTVIVRARLFDLEGRLGILAWLHIVNIGAPSKIGRWEVSGISHGQEIPGVVGVIPDSIKSTALKGARSINDFATAESRATIGGFHPLASGVNRFRPGNGVIWAVFEEQDVTPATVRVSFVDDNGKRYSIAPSPIVAQMMRNEKNSQEPFDKRLNTAGL